MKILVTGGAGFIGSNFIRYWLNSNPDDEIINLDALSYAGNPNNLKDFDRNNRYRFVKGNITDSKLVGQLMSEVDGIIHFAAESHVTRSEDDPEIFYETNVLGTKNLLENAAKHDLKKFVHISTDEVYGSIKSGYFKEADKLPGIGQASSAYSKSKSQADDLARSFFDKLPIIIIRPTNNFGPYQYPEKALPRWITAALLGEKLKVWGAGSQVRDWLFATDTARAIELIWKNVDKSEIYNIGANHEPEHNNLEIAKRVLSELGKDNKLIEMIPDPRPEHDFRYGVDTSKIRALGWKAGNFDEEFNETVQWYKDNEDWWRPLKKDAESLYKNREKSK